MGILAVDPLLLREPRLLMPRLKPFARVRIDTSHPAANGLAYVQLCNGDMRDLTGKIADATIVDTVGVGAGAQGRHFNFTAAGGVRISPGNHGCRTMLGSPTDLSVLLVASAANTAARTVVLGDWNSDGSGNSLIAEWTGWEQPSNSFGFAVGGLSSGLGYAVARLSCQNNVIYAFGVTLGGGVVQSFADGKLGAPGIFSSWLGDSGTQYPAIGQPGALTVLRSSAKVYFVALWNRSIGSALMQELTADPYQFLVPA